MSNFFLPAYPNLSCSFVMKLTYFAAILTTDMSGRTILMTITKLPSLTVVTSPLGVVDATLANNQDTVHTSGSDPKELFVKLATKVDQYNHAMTAVKVDNIGSGCSKFQKVKLKEFDCDGFSSDIGVALKRLYVNLDDLIKECLKSISSVCLQRCSWPLKSLEHKLPLPDKISAFVRGQLVGLSIHLTNLRLSL
ncbi:hypothetical protein AG1IA_01942 [Rhizoctonia solani AG-1 IA]|uniref:Uncharacterized protein n=1 Tax=Thanatephorus cucumeris (strain AG1-IA) TaxID=983506 RepID=L8X112_THACA|nr:hypothetical protein AG1IA_01942 [Rhizoctonia solani AG-1 IA]